MFTTTKPSRLIPATEWARYHPWPPIGGLRHLIHYEHQNGFARCVRRVGRKVLIDEDEFFAWVQTAAAPKKGRRAKAPGTTAADIREAVDAIHAAAEGP